MNHYFSENPEIKSNKRNINYIINNKKLISLYGLNNNFIAK